LEHPWSFSGLSLERPWSVLGFGLNLKHVSHLLSWARASLCILASSIGLPDVLLSFGSLRGLRLYVAYVVSRRAFGTHNFHVATSLLPALCGIFLYRVSTSIT